MGGYKVELKDGRSMIIPHVDHIKKPFRFIEFYNEEHGLQCMINKKDIRFMAVWNYNND